MSKNFFNVKNKPRNVIVKKYEFILKNINPNEKVEVIEEITYCIPEENKNILITDLSTPPIETVVNKEKLQHYITMMDYDNIIVPQSTNIPCLYCRRIYKTNPLGIPIIYYPSMVQTTIKTENGIISLLTPGKLINKTCKVVKNEYFVVEGLVCSFNCIVSIVEESNNNVYKNTISLMYLMYKKIFGNYPQKSILRSPNYKLRKEYGGPLTDEEYEKCLQCISFVDTSQIKSYIAGRLYEVYEKK